MSEQGDRARKMLERYVDTLLSGRGKRVTPQTEIPHEVGVGVQRGVLVGGYFDGVIVKYEELPDDVYMLRLVEKRSGRKERVFDVYDRVGVHASVPGLVRYVLRKRKKVRK
jgi:hypothetical protein